MLIIIKVTSFGKASRGVILLKKWLEFIESRVGCSIQIVKIEANDSLTISPLIESPNDFVFFESEKASFESCKEVRN